MKRVSSSDSTSANVVTGFDALEMDFGVGGGGPDSFSHCFRCSRKRATVALASVTWMKCEINGQNANDRATYTRMLSALYLYL